MMILLDLLPLSLHLVYLLLFDLPSYAHHLFLNGSEVTDLTIPGSVTSVGNYVFSGCSSLTKVTIPSFVTSIGYDAFEGCTGLASVNIKDIVSWLEIP